jgi:hypothetical protein
MHRTAAAARLGYATHCMGTDERAQLLREALRTIAARCPRMIAECYWAGTSAISLEELGHRESFDLDFHSRNALVDTRPFLAELQRAFPGSLELIQGPDARGSGFSAVVQVGDERLTLQVFAAFEDVPNHDLVASSTESTVLRVSLQRYLADKVQCVLERIEARDLVDIQAVLRARPRLRYSFQKAVAAQDALLLAERLLGWTDDAIRDDLLAYAGVDPVDAISMRDELLRLLKTEGDIS